MPKKILLFTIAICFIACYKDDEQQIIQTDTAFLLCNIQDNLIEIDGVENMNYDLINGVKLNDFGFKMLNQAILLESDHRIRTIIPIGFNFDYEINYLSDNTAELRSTQMNDYLSGSDTFEFEVNFVVNH